MKPRIIKPKHQDVKLVIYQELPKDKNGVIYVRQSSLVQMQNNIHSFEMQTDKFVEHFRKMGFTGHIEIVSDDEAMKGKKRSIFLTIPTSPKQRR